jgi:hypothetical protein
MWQQLPSGRVTHRFELVVLTATLALIPVLIIENDAKSQKWQDIAYGANWVIWAVFALELAFHPDRRSKEESRAPRPLGRCDPGRRHRAALRQVPLLAEARPARSPAPSLPEKRPDPKSD